MAVTMQMQAMEDAMRTQSLREQDRAASQVETLHAPEGRAFTFVQWKGAEHVHVSVGREQHVDDPSVGVVERMRVRVRVRSRRVGIVIRKRR